jgi:hypothetical protein
MQAHAKKKQFSKTLYHRLQVLCSEISSHIYTIILLTARTLPWCAVHVQYYYRTGDILDYILRSTPSRQLVVLTTTNFNGNETPQDW